MVSRRVENRSPTDHWPLTTDHCSYADAFPPFVAVALESASLRITVAGQWRIFTAFPATAIHICKQRISYFESLPDERDARSAARRIRINHQVRIEYFFEAALGHNLAERAIGHHLA